MQALRHLCPPLDEGVVELIRRQPGEAEIAFTELFGGFGPRFLAAYQVAWPLDPGYADRHDLYNLYHLLHHLNLFGEGYGPQVDAVPRRYVG